MVLGYVNDNLVPVSHPFYLDAQGKMMDFVIKDNQTIDARLWRKYPMFQHVFIINDVLRGGYVEASDNPDFAESESVVSFPEWSITSGIEQVSQTRPYRYWRLCADVGRKCDMAELFFIDEPGNRLKPVMNDALTDYDPLTYYSADGHILKEYIDFGKPVEIDRVQYVRRGDGNAIIPGDCYQIFYWGNDGEWVHHSSHIASDIFIDVKNLPSGTLYYIKGLSRGVQHRIFSINAVTGEVEWR